MELNVRKTTGRIDWNIMPTASGSPEEKDPNREQENPYVTTAKKASGG
jgi:hypothetical protein